MASPSPRVLISCAKGETHDHREGFRPLYKRLRVAGYAPAKLSAAASDSAAGSTDSGITATALAGAAVLVFGCPTQRFSAAELDVLRAFLRQGGSILVCSAAGGEVRAGSNLNLLLEECGVSVLPDCLLAGAGQKAASQGRLEKGGACPDGLGPTEVWLPGGTFAAAGGIGCSGFVFPSGATLAVQKPAVTLLSSGPCAHPAERPVAACCHMAGQGKLAVLGSVAALEGRWLKAVEGNARLADWLFQWLTPGSNLVNEPQMSEVSAASSAEARPHRTRSLGPGPLAVSGSQLGSGARPVGPSLAQPSAASQSGQEVSDDRGTQRLDTWAESEQLRCCVQDDGAIPEDISELLDETIYILAPTLLQKLAPLYEQLGVHQEPLSLIAPELDVPSPPLQAAVFPPVWREPPPPPLEMFDLNSLLPSPELA